MADEQVALLFFIIIAWSFGRQVILKYKPIPKWLDVSIAVVFLILTVYTAYDTYYLIEVYNVGSIHNGPIFDPLDSAQRP